MAKIDFKELREKAVGVAQEAASKSKELADKSMELAAEAKYEFDLKTINPIHEERFNSIEYHVPSIIQVMDYDKKMENPVCEGAWGFQEKIKDKSLLCLMSESVEKTELNFIPYMSNTFYYRNPYIENTYICLDEYFQYIQDAKVHELEMIAQSLGAKKVKIAFKEIKKTLVSNSRTGDAKVKLPFGKKSGVAVNANYNESENQFSNIEIASEIEFVDRKDPVEPTLTYFKGNMDIMSLVKMRLEKDNPIKSKTFKFNCVQGRDMQKNDAVSIDAILEKKGFAGNVSIVSEVQQEQRKVLEYSIEF